MAIKLDVMDAKPQYGKFDIIYTRINPSHPHPRNLLLGIEGLFDSLYGLIMSSEYTVSLLVEDYINCLEKYMGVEEVSRDLFKRTIRIILLFLYRYVEDYCSSQSLLSDPKLNYTVSTTNFYIEAFEILCNKLDLSSRKVFSIRDIKSLIPAGFINSNSKYFIDDLGSTDTFQQIPEWELTQLIGVVNYLGNRNVVNELMLLDGFDVHIHQYFMNLINITRDELVTGTRVSSVFIKNLRSRLSKGISPDDLESYIIFLRNHLNDQLFPSLTSFLGKVDGHRNPILLMLSRLIMAIDMYRRKQSSQ